jgi:hypothetical protein
VRGVVGELVWETFAAILIRMSVAETTIGVATTQRSWGDFDGERAKNSRH